MPSPWRRWPGFDPAHGGAAATPGPEGALRFPEVTPPAFGLDPTPVYSDRPSTGPGAPVVYDLATGIETVQPLPVGPFAPYGFVTGRVVGEVVHESVSRSFNQLQTRSPGSYPWSSHGRMWASTSTGSTLNSSRITNKISEPHMRECFVLKHHVLNLEHLLRQPANPHEVDRQSSKFAGT